MVATARSKWGDEDTDSLGLPASEVIDSGNGVKKVISYRINEEGQKEKLVRTFRIETRKTRYSAAVESRKNLKKFGDAKGEKPGPSPSTTAINDPIYMVFAGSKDEESSATEDPLKKLVGTKIVMCRICKGEHWTTKCPYKDKLGPAVIGNSENDDSKTSSTGISSSNQTPSAASTLGLASANSNSSPSNSASGAYVPPGMGGRPAGSTVEMAGRGGRFGGRDGHMGSMGGMRDDTATIRVTNLSEDVREDELQDLFKEFGSISRIFLAKDKVTGQSKGFAFVNFHKKEEAAKAIEALNGYGLYHLILNLEWAKPANTN